MSDETKGVTLNAETVKTIMEYLKVTDDYMFVVRDKSAKQDDIDKVGKKIHKLGLQLRRILTPDIIYCSFCSKGHNEVKKMIAGYDGYICDECVELSMEIVSEDTEQVKDKGENKDDK